MEAKWRAVWCAVRKQNWIGKLTGSLLLSVGTAHGPAPKVLPDLRANCSKSAPNRAARLPPCDHSQTIDFPSVSSIFMRIRCFSGYLGCGTGNYLRVLILHISGHFCSDRSLFAFFAIFAMLRTRAHFFAPDRKRLV